MVSFRGLYPLSPALLVGFFCSVPMGKLVLTWALLQALSVA